MNRRQLLLATLGLPLAAARAQQEAGAPASTTTPEQEKFLQRLFVGGFLNGLGELPESQRPMRGFWLLVEPNALPQGKMTPESEARMQAMQVVVQRLTMAPSLDDFALVFDLQKTRVGSIHAFVPRVMPLLNADKRLGKELPLAELAKANPLTVLLGTLSDGQFKQLIGDGLSFTDLDASQASLLRVALPETLTAEPTKGQPDYKLYKTDPQAYQTAQKAFEARRKTYSEQEIHRDLRLRTFLHTSYSFDSPEPGDSGLMLRPTENGQEWVGKEWQLEGGIYSLHFQQGQNLADFLLQSVPAKLRRGELAWSREALGAGVALVGVKTVREVVERVAAATQLSLFVDPRFARRAVKIVADANQPALARDIVRALALALSGVWRRVGNAFVLTHDLTGRADLFAVQKEIVSVWARRLTEAAAQSGARLDQLDWLKTIPFAPGDLSASTHDLLQKSRVPGGVTWSELPNRLKVAFEVQFDTYSGPPERMENESAEDADRRMGSFHRLAQRVRSGLKDTSPVGLSAELQFAIEMPGTGPMALGEARRIPDQRWFARPPESPKTIIAVDPVKLNEPARALLVRADSPEEARNAVATAAQLGFNIVYLNVFHNGRPAFETEALKSRTAEAKKTLAAAIAAGKEQKIAVWAALDLLRWRSDLASKSPEPMPDGFSEDLSLLNETGSQTVKRRLAEDSFEDRWSGENFYKYNPGGHGWVSPMNQNVRKTLIQLVTDLAKTEGLSGIAFQRTAMSGYIPLDYYYNLDNIEFGYGLDHRQAFLKTGGGDPVDIGNLRYLGMGFSAGGDYINFEVKLPGFDEESGTSPIVKNWQDFRATASRTLMHEIFAAVRIQAPSLPLTLRERTMERNFEPWTEATKLTELTDLSSSADALGKLVGPKSLVVVSLYDGLRQNGPRVLESIKETRKETGRGKATGIVLELEGSDTISILKSISGHFSATGKPF
jgi:hypothetical protein